jgi:hypothetical protein
MAIANVLFTGIRVNDAETATNWTAAGVTSAAIEPDFKYQGTNCISGQVKTSQAGFYYRNAAASYNFSSPQNVWIAKVTITNKDSLDGTGLILEMGTGARTNYWQYYVWSGVTAAPYTQPYPIKGGFTIVPIDPNIANYRNVVQGTGATLTTIDMFGVQADCAATSKAPNLGMDAIDFVPVGSGLILTGGDGASARGTFSNFISYDEGTLTNRYGVVSTQEGILYVTGALTIGSNTATGFDDSNRVLVFPSGRFGIGFAGVKFGLQNASTTIAMTNCFFNSRGSGMSSTLDTRPDYTVSGLNGLANITGCTFDTFRRILANTQTTFTSCSFLNGLQIVQDNATFTSCNFSRSTAGADVAYVISNNPQRISYANFVYNSGHAIQITAPGSYVFTGNKFTGYTGSGTVGAAIYNTSGGEVTLTIAGGGDTPTYKNVPPSSIIINNDKSLTLTGMKDNTEVRIYAAGTQTELAGIENAIDGTTDNRSFTFALPASTSTDMRIFNIYYLPVVYLSYTHPTTDSTLQIQQVFDRVYSPG